MAISRERLEELIKQGATIYRAYADVCVEEFKLNKEYKVSTAYLWKKMKHSAFKGCGYPLDQLFETKEDAEEYAEFGNITKTDTLKLPMWEDVKDTGYDEIFFVKDNRFDGGVVQYYFLVAEQTNQIQIMFREIDHLMIITAYDVIFNKLATRENYNEARRLCVKLFKGEE